MKKLLLSALCAATAFVGSADNASWDFVVAKDNYTKSLASPTTLNMTTDSSKGSWTFTYDSESYQNAANVGPSFGSANNVVKSGTFELKGSEIPENATITKVIFTVKGGKKDVAESSWDLFINDQKAGSTQTTTKGNGVTPLTWDNLNSTGNNIKFSLTQASTAGFNLQKVEVTYTVGDSSKENAGLAFPEASYTVEFGQDFSAPALTNPNGLEVTYESSNTEVATVDAEGKVTLVGGGQTTITAKSAETDKFNAGSASYTLVVEKKVASFSEIYALGKNVAIEVGFPMVVTYVNGSNYYVQRQGAEDYSLLYASDLSYKIGDVIPAGWTCKYSPYNDMPEIVPASVKNMPASTETAEVAYAKVSNVTAADVNRVVVIENVTFAEATPSAKNTSFTGTVNDGTDAITFRTNFSGVPSVAAGSYDVTCAVASYYSNLQSYPISYTEHTSTGIDEVVAESEQHCATFDLQGRRVLTPRKGMIYVQGGKKIRF